MHDLTGFQRDLRYVIAGSDEPYGIALKNELDDYYEGEINHGRLYPNLDTLADKGLVEKGRVTGCGHTYVTNTVTSPCVSAVTRYPPSNTENQSRSDANSRNDLQVPDASRQLA